MAEYFSEVQWAARDTTEMREEPLGMALPVNLGPIFDSKVEAAARKMKWGKACGSDGVPGDLWKAVAAPGSPARRWATALCSKCWEDGVVPNAWHESLVVAIF